MAEEKVYQFGAYRLNVGERSLIGPGEVPIALTSRRLATLVFMLERPNQLLSKQALLEDLWDGAVVEENTLAQVVSWLRKALADRPGRDRYIETVPGVGYRFVKPVRLLDSDSSRTSGKPASIAVLPFDDLTSTGKHAHLADGIAEEILNRLGQVSGLRVIGRASSFVFRGTKERAQTIAHELGVEYLLTGALRKDGERIRVTVQLVEAFTGNQVWSERFDGELKDIFAIQDDISIGVASAVDVSLGDQADSGRTANPQAHDLYLRARAAAHRTGAEGMLRAAELYRKALALDPAFTRAWLGLAEASRGIFLFAPAHAAEARRTLDEAAQRAIGLAPDFWVSHIAESWRLSLKRDWIGYDRALKRAQSLAPGMPAELSLAKAICLSQSGRMRAAVEPARRAVRDDPLSLLPSNILQMILHAAGCDEESEQEYQRSLDLAGARDTAEHTALQRAWVKEDETLIEERFGRYLQNRTLPMPVLDRVFEVRRRPSEVLRVLRAAVSDASNQAPVPQMQLAWWLARFGDDDTAIAAIARAQLDFDGAFCNWLWFPVLAKVRSQNAFKALLHRLDLPEYWRSTDDWGDFARPGQRGEFECF